MSTALFDLTLCATNDYEALLASVNVARSLIVCGTDASGNTIAEGAFDIYNGLAVAYETCLNDLSIYYYACDVPCDVNSSLWNYPKGAICDLTGVLAALSPLTLSCTVADIIEILKWLADEASDRDYLEYVKVANALCEIVKTYAVVIRRLQKASITVSPCDL